MSRTLLIDNYDSFTYNLAALIAEATGYEPVIVRNDEASWDQLRDHGFDRIVISPGPGRPQCRVDLGLSAEVLEHASVPILGVCLGHQAIGHFFGATVDLAQEAIHGRIGKILHEGRGLFAGIPTPFEATRYHSLAVTHLPSELEPSAWCDDGTLMALRHVSLPIWGVQFHPESICTEYGQKMIQNFYEMSEPFLPSAKIDADPAAVAPTPWASMRMHALRCGSSLAPHEAFETLFGDDTRAFWLDSSRPNQANAWFSYFGDARGPYSETLEYYSVEQRLKVQTRDGTSERRQDILGYLQAELIQRAKPTPEQCPFNFNGGYVGYFGYELKGELQGMHAHPASTPDACWIFADRTVVHDHKAGEYWLLCLDDAAGLCGENQRWVAHVQSVLAGAPRTCQAATGRPVVRSLDNLRWRHTPERYLELIHRSMELIRQGETYEVCLTNELTADVDADPLPVYLRMREVNPVPFGALLRFDDISVLCSSPELYIDISTDGVVESKPIKGTAARHPNQAEDCAIAANLAASVKDRSENLMIVDLLRNDLNRCCEVGSVHVPKIFQIESFATVHQLVSTVRGKLKTGCGAIDCVRESFPGGSMTGAPKVRTMSIIDDLECGPRGVYSGSIGYLALNGSARLNIVIRTIVMRGSRISIGAGGAIVALSNPQEELDEIMLKSRAQVQLLQMLAEPDTAVAPIFALAAAGDFHPGHGDARTDTDEIRGSSPDSPSPAESAQGMPSPHQGMNMSFEEQISEARRRIDAIDQQLIELLQTRFRCCLAVGELKRRYDRPVVQPSRMQEVTDRAAAACAAHGMSSEFARAMWHLIIDEACRMEYEVMEAEHDCAAVATASHLSNA